MLLQSKIPKLTIPIITQIVSDAAPESPSIKAVGIVGSFARGEETPYSDVDIIVKYIPDTAFQSILENFGAYVEHVLDYQFNRRLDVVRYDLAAYRAAMPPKNIENWYCQNSYTQMLKEVRWIYER